MQPQSWTAESEIHAVDSRIFGQILETIPMQTLMTLEVLPRSLSSMFTSRISCLMPSMVAIRARGRSSLLELTTSLVSCADCTVQSSADHARSRLVPSRSGRTCMTSWCGC
eukprot:8470648-Pyramimonas_sp.AAC.1